MLWTRRRSDVEPHGDPVTHDEDDSPAPGRDDAQDPNGGVTYVRGGAIARYNRRKAKQATDGAEPQPEKRVLVVRRLRIWYYPALLAIVCSASALLFADSRLTVRCVRAPSLPRSGECVIATEAVFSEPEARRLPLSTITGFSTSLQTTRGVGKYSPGTENAALVVGTSGGSLSFDTSTPFLWLDKSLDPAEVEGLDGFLSDPRRTSASLDYGGFVGAVASAGFLVLFCGVLAAFWARVEWRLTLSAHSFECESDDAGVNESTTSHARTGVRDVVPDPRRPRLLIRYASGASVPTPSFRVSRKRLERVAARVQGFIHSGR